MDYKRNHLYFTNPRRFNFIWLVLGLLVAGGLIYATFSGIIPIIWVGYGLAGLFVIIGLAFGAMFPLYHHINDHLIDKDVRVAVLRFEEQALTQLKITPLKSDLLKTVRFYDFADTTKYKDIKILDRIGKDGIRRTSHCRLTCYFFLDSKFVAYFSEFSLIKPWLAEGYTTYYYSEMSSKEIHEVNTEDNPYLQSVTVVKK